MARRPREDEPDTWHRVYNRGLAKRTLFETRNDIRYFMAQLARQVRCGRIEVHAYAILTTHFHLLVRSVTGELSEAMRRVQNAYVRYFNRSRRRDGSLMRGRFSSRLVDSDEYHVTLMSYIDMNAVDAGLVKSACDFEYGSARWYAIGCGPKWLTRTWFEAYLESIQAPFKPAVTYRDWSELGLSRSQRKWLEWRRTSTARSESLIDAAPESVLDWMRRKAQLADGTGVCESLVQVELIDELIESERGAEPWMLKRGRAVRDAWLVMHVALARDVAGLTFTEIAKRFGVSRPTIRAIYSFHKVSLEQVEYAETLARLGRASQTLPPGVRHRTGGVSAARR